MNIDLSNLAAVIGGPWGMIIAAGLILLGPRLASRFPRLAPLFAKPASTPNSPAPGGEGGPLVPLVPAGPPDRPVLDLLRLLLARKNKSFDAWVEEKIEEEAAAKRPT